MMLLVERVLRDCADKRMKEDECRTKAWKGAKRRERGGTWKADPAPSLYILPAAFPQKGNFTYQLASSQAIRSFPLAHQFRFFFPSLTVNNYT